MRAFIALVFLFVVGCAVTPTKERSQVDQLFECARKEGNESSCTEKYKDFIYVGEVESVKLVDNYSLVTVSLGCSQKDPILGCMTNYIIRCQNKEDSKFEERAKKLKKGDRVEVNGKPYGFLKPEWPTLNQCTLTQSK